MFRILPSFTFFFFNDTATTEIYTLSLHDALPISAPTERLRPELEALYAVAVATGNGDDLVVAAERRSEEHTSELQSQSNLVCRLLLEKKKKKTTRQRSDTTIIQSTSAVMSSAALA